MEGGYNRVNKNVQLYDRYFVYSSEEEAMRIKIHGENASFGTVIVRGVPKRYTSIVTSLDNAKSDAIEVAHGDIRKMQYTPPTKK